MTDSRMSNGPLLSVKDTDDADHLTIGVGVDSLYRYDGRAPCRGNIFNDHHLAPSRKR